MRITLCDICRMEIPPYQMDDTMTEELEAILTDKDERITRFKFKIITDIPSSLDVCISCLKDAVETSIKAKYSI